MWSKWKDKKKKVKLYYFIRWSGIFYFKENLINLMEGVGRVVIISIGLVILIFFFLILGIFEEVKRL